MNKQPNVTQKVILKYKNKIMIMKHDNDNFDFPGGQLEWKENLFESLQRELKEELNFELKHQPRLFGVWNFFKEESGEDRHSVIINYIYELEERQDVVSPEGMEIMWLTRDEMKEVVRDAGHVDRMFDWQDNQSEHLMYYCN